jgi:Domain of unknown function (DUF1844)
LARSRSPLCLSVNTCPSFEERDMSEPTLPPATFSQLVVSLGSSALVHLGELSDPGSGGSQIDLPMARHSVDVLSLLQEKTKGNLTEPETQLLATLIDELRAKLVAAG